MTRTATRTTRIAGGLLAAALGLAGCSSGGDTSGAAAGSTAAESSASQEAAFNNADVTFVQQMIPHHRSALAMAKLADGRAEDPRVLDLAAQIEAAQQPEIDTMVGWLEEWGEPVPADDGSMEGMDMGGMDMGGMSAEDMSALESASGAEFDRMFLQMMTEHHRGAVAMAEKEITDGSYPDAVALAEDIVKSQSAEIDTMEKLLAELEG